jgi:hypothetical protein
VAVRARQEHGSCRRACRRCVEIRQAHTLTRQPIEIRGSNLRPKWANIAVSQIIRHDDEEVRSRGPGLCRGLAHGVFFWSKGQSSPADCQSKTGQVVMKTYGPKPTLQLAKPRTQYPATRVPGGCRSGETPIIIPQFICHELQAGLVRSAYVVPRNFFV